MQKPTRITLQTDKRMLYLLPHPGNQGGMTVISKMFYETGIFDQDNIKHFNTSFSTSFKLSRFFESLYLKLKFIIVLLRFKPHSIFVMTSSYWGFYDKCLYCLIARCFSVKSNLNSVGGGFADFYESNILNRWLVNKSTRFADVLSVGSTYWYNYFRETFPDQNVVQVANPVISERYRHRKNEDTPRVKVVTISGMIREKGVEELVGVVKDACSRNPMLEFVFMGDGNKLEWMKHQLASEIARGNAIFKGFVQEEEKVKELTSADIFILLTYFEVQPISMLEAMSASLPVISTPVGGIPDLVRDGENGYLFPPGTTTGVADRLLEMAKDRMKLREMGSKSYNIILKEYDIHAVIEKHLSIAELF